MRHCLMHFFTATFHSIHTSESDSISLRISCRKWAVNKNGNESSTDNNNNSNRRRMPLNARQANFFSFRLLVRFVLNTKSFLWNEFCARDDDRCVECVVRTCVSDSTESHGILFTWFRCRKIDILRALVCWIFSSCDDRAFFVFFFFWFACCFEIDPIARVLHTTLESSRSDEMNSEGFVVLFILQQKTKWLTESTTDEQWMAAANHRQIRGLCWKCPETARPHFEWQSCLLLLLESVFFFASPFPFVLLFDGFCERDCDVSLSSSDDDDDAHILNGAESHAGDLFTANEQHNFMEEFVYALWLHICICEEPNTSPTTTTTRD